MERFGFKGIERGGKKTVQQTVACLVLEARNIHELETPEGIGDRSEKWIEHTSRPGVSVGRVYSQYTGRLSELL